MAAGGASRRVVVIALLANAGIAVAKIVAGLVTGSSAMLAEALHSVADAGNQALLLLGDHRARRGPDARHPLGYAREAYFWAMVVAGVLFTLGGLYSLMEGIEKLRHPHEIEQPLWALGVLVVALVLESGSMRAAWVARRQSAPGQPLLAWARSTSDVTLLVVFFEDLAALAGLVLAFIAVGAAALTHNPIFDALGSVLIGVLLLGVAVFLAMQVRRLIVGFSASPDLQAAVREMFEKEGFSVLELVALWEGPAQILLLVKVKPPKGSQSSEDLIRRIDGCQREVRKRFPAVHVLHVEPDLDSRGP